MTRTRTARGQGERDRKKLDEAKLKLAALEEGYRPDRPLVVESASQIEPHVRGMTCPVCDVSYQVAEHVATPCGRVVEARCPQRARTPKIHFVLRSTSTSILRNGRVEAAQFDACSCGCEAPDNLPIVT